MDAANPESMCDLGTFVWAPGMVLAAAVAGLVITWLVLAALRVRPRALVVLVVPSFTVVAALAYHSAAAGKIVVAALVLGFGLAAAAVVEAYLHRESRVEAGAWRLSR